MQSPEEYCADEIKECSANPVTITRAREWHDNCTEAANTPKDYPPVGSHQLLGQFDFRYALRHGARFPINGSDSDII
jgi:hypothetical protein